MIHTHKHLGVYRVATANQMKCPFPTAVLNVRGINNLAPGSHFFSLFQIRPALFKAQPCTCPGVNDINPEESSLLEKVTHHPGLSQDFAYGELLTVWAGKARKENGSDYSCG